MTLSPTLSISSPSPLSPHHHLSFLTKTPYSTSLRFLSGRSRFFLGRQVFTVRAKAKDLILGNPSFTVEKGKYNYDVETLIDKLSSLPPRGSIAWCLDLFKNKFSLNDFALVFKEFTARGDWQRSVRLFKFCNRTVPSYACRKVFD